jgi:hypothetical protein
LKDISGLLADTSFIVNEIRFLRDTFCDWDDRLSPTSGKTTSGWENTLLTAGFFFKIFYSNSLISRSVAMCAPFRSKRPANACALAVTSGCKHSRNADAKASIVHFNITEFH